MEDNQTPGSVETVKTVKSNTQVTEKKEPAAPLDVVRNVRGKFQFWHDCFKSTVAVMKKNVSFRRRQLILEEYEHRHNFHSHDRMGVPQKHCVAVGGHYHEVKVIREPGKPLRAECGPPLRKIKKTDKYGFERSTEELVKFEDAANARDVVDDHRHDFQYLHSEELTADHRPLPVKADIPQLDPKFKGDVKGL